MQEKSDSGQSNLEFLLDSFLSLGVGLSVRSVLLVFSVGVLLFSLLVIDRVFSDFLVGLLVKFFHSFHLGGGQSLSPAGELFIEVFL